jgi:hypothetical protein
MSGKCGMRMKCAQRKRGREVTIDTNGWKHKTKEATHFKWQYLDLSLIFIVVVVIISIFIYAFKYSTI